MPHFHRLIAIAIVMSLDMDIFYVYQLGLFPLSESDSNIAKESVQNPFLATSLSLIAFAL